MTPHRFYQPVWTAVEPNPADLASIQEQEWPEGHLGVRRTKSTHGSLRFLAAVKVNEAWYRSLRYHTAEEAARAYNSMVRHFFGPSATLNAVPGELFADTEVARIIQRQLRQITLRSAA